MMIKIPELLSPAGGLEQLKAAVENGADAVYMGGQLFNARLNAENFDDETLLSGLDYAHIRGVNLYVAMNTVVADDELNAALDYAGRVYEAGADALILQDLGFAGLVHRHLPDLPIHLSTQATVYNIEGVRAAERLGFSRVILARELGLEGITDICSQAASEIEVFVHGSLCMSYSGQCLLSQTIGGRSGNRGQCAQPCRLPYSLHKHDTLRERELVKNAYLLSPKDLWSIEHLEQLIKAGVSSLKIEGRMKSPEYVAIVTGIYRKYLDKYRETQNAPVEVAESDIKALKQSFNRGGFTTGYLFGNPGMSILSGKLPKHQGVYIGRVKTSYPARRLLDVLLEDQLSVGDGIEIWSDNPSIDNMPARLPGNLVTFMKKNSMKADSGEKGDLVTIGDIDGEMSPGDPVYKITDKQLNNLAQASYLHKPAPRVAVTCRFFAKRGQPIRLLVRDNEGREVSAVSGYIPEEALNRATTLEMIKAQLDKTGGTPFKMSEIQSEIDEGLAIPMSYINQLRRTALEELTLKRQHKYPLRHKPATADWRLPAQTKAAAKALPEEAARHVPAGAGINKCLYFYPLNGSKKYQLVNKNFEEHLFDAHRIYLPYNCFLTLEYHEIFEAYAAKKIPLIPVIPPITLGYHDEVLRENLGKLLEHPYASGICAGNMGWVSECLQRGAKLYGDYALNFYNSCSFELAKTMGFKGAVIAHEATIEQIAEMSFSGLSVEAAAFGRLPVMITEHCLIGNQKDSPCSEKKCESCNSGSFYIKDRKAAEFPVLTDPESCRVTILSHQTRPMKYTSSELKKAGISDQRWYILDESISDIEGL